MKKKLVGIVSPPFEDSLNEYKGDEEYWKKFIEIAEKKHGKGRVRKIITDHINDSYGSSKGQIGLLKSDNIEEESFDITKFHSCKGNLYWKGCYESFKDWKSFVTADSFAHPAKMSAKLCDRIFKHLKKLGLLRKGDTVCDFMSGIGTTNIMASLHGFDSVAVELEPHFIKMIEDNKANLEKLTGRKQDWEVIQGDSRQLSQLLQKKGLVGITSPPFLEAISIQAGGQQKQQNIKWIEDKKIHSIYSSNQQNIGNLKDKKLVEWCECDD